MDNMTLFYMESDRRFVNISQPAAESESHVRYCLLTVYWYSEKCLYSHSNMTFIVLNLHQ